MPSERTPNSDNAAFVQTLVREVPELASIYHEHIDFNEELLPHLLMADVGRFAVANAGNQTVNLPL
jgi:hypothetical protein